MPILRALIRHAVSSPRTGGVSASGRRLPVLPGRLLLMLVLALTPAPQLAGQPTGTESGGGTILPDHLLRIDSLFASWDHTRTPGCALGVARRGELVLERGYGMAELDHGVPLSSTSTFYLASVSKQFTAAAVVLAAQEGLLSLDDDLARHFPELRDYGGTLTVRHLLHHTSGIRDYLTLMSLADMSYGDSWSEEEVLELIFRQEELNFPPGDEHLYSNSGYVLLAELVRRATGRTLREYTQEKIFKPLGMTRTHFHDDPTQVVPERVISYVPGPEGTFRVSYLLNFRLVGDGGLYSTLEDLARWDGNFYEPAVGGPSFVETMQTRGILTGGDTLAYAMGLSLGEHRGLPTVSHGGSMMGFRTTILRFPSEELTVMTLCNLGTINPSRLASGVAEILLQDRMAPPRPPDTSGTPTTSQRRDPVPPPDAGQLALLAGRYYSPELDAQWELAVEDNGLRVVRREGGGQLLTPVEPGLLRSGSLVLRFQGWESGTPEGFLLDAGRVRNLRFLRRE